MTAPANPWLDPATIQAALVELCAHRATSGEPCALVGGVAGQLFGTNRFTRDVDVLAWRPLAGYPMRSPLAMEAIAGYQSQTRGRTPLDVLTVEGSDEHVVGLLEEGLRRACPTGGCPLPVLPMPHWIALKVAAGRGKDEGDISELVKRGVLAGEGLQAARRVTQRWLGREAREDLDGWVRLARLEAAGGGRRALRRQGRGRGRRPG